MTSSRPLAPYIDVVYGACLLILALVIAGPVLHTDLLSHLGQLVLFRQMAVVGLLVLGQLFVFRHRDIDLGAPAQIALATVLAIGLGDAWGSAVAVGATIAVGQVVAFSCATAIDRWKMPAAWVTLIPLVAVPAILPQTSARLAPVALVAFATGELGGLPYPLLAWFGLALAAALIRNRPISRAAAFACAGACWSVLGLTTAGRSGAVSDLTPWITDAGLGLGIALLVAGKPRTAVPAGMLLAAVASIVLQIGAESPAVAPVLAAVVLLVGVQTRSTDLADPEDLDLDAVGPHAARIDNPHPPGPDLAGFEEPNRNDA